VSDNAELIRKTLAALDAGGVEAILEYVDPGFEFSTPASLSVEPGTYSGHEGIRRYFAEFYDAMDEVRLLPDEFIEVGDLVVVPMRLATRGRETGIESEQPAVAVWRVEGARVTGLEIFATLAEAMESAEDGA
jgi:ketosteroid isomerase-like protein